MHTYACMEGAEEEEEAGEDYGRAAEEADLEEVHFYCACDVFALWKGNRDKERDCNTFEQKRVLRHSGIKTYMSVVVW